MLLSSWNRRKQNAGTGGPRWRMKFTMAARTSQLAMKDEIAVAGLAGGWKEEFTVESANMCCPWLKQELWMLWHCFWLKHELLMLEIYAASLVLRQWRMEAKGE
ncbi:hypothetical protein NC651_003684 [Populus alba x Populus x berolinensis]|nr:hypothetical protein NC651_003684 [Populus alba x Populus x berolinensis]